MSSSLDSNGGKGVLSYEEARDLKKSMISTLASTEQHSKSPHRIGGSSRENRPSMEGGISLDTEDEGTHGSHHALSGQVLNNR